jgi:predicted GIY-YIG superfamily endonuclease
MSELHVLYRYFDEDDTLLYVGITNSPLVRMSQHLRDKAWFRNAIRTTYEHFSSRAEVEAAEVEAIRTEKPKYNIAHAVGPLPQQIGVKPRISYTSSRDANRFQAPDAIASDDLTDEEHEALMLERERRVRYWLRGTRCPSCELICLYREYDGLIKCSNCLDMFTPDEIPSEFALLEQRREENRRDRTTP